MTSDAVERYCKNVGKLLICTDETRRELTDGLRGELTELPPERSDSVEKLETYYGKIPETAVSLQDAVSPKERASALARQRKLKIAVCAAAAVVFVLFALLFYIAEIDRPDKTVVEPPIVQAGEVSPGIPDDPANK